MARERSLFVNVEKPDGIARGWNSREGELLFLVLEFSFILKYFANYFRTSFINNLILIINHHVKIQI